MKHGTTAAIRFFAKKYPKLPLKETTVQRLNNMYQSQVQQKHSAIERKVTIKAIVTANQKVTEVLEKQGGKSIRGHYYTLTPAQKLTVGRKVSETRDHSSYTVFC